MKRCTVYREALYVMLCVVFTLGAVGHSQTLDSQAVWDRCLQDWHQFTRAATYKMWNVPPHTDAEDIVLEACMRIENAVKKGIQQIDNLSGLLRVTVQQIIVEKTRLHETWREVRDPSMQLAGIADERDISDSIDARESLESLHSYLGEELYDLLST